MNSTHRQGAEGIRAHLNALQRVQKGLSRRVAGSAASIRRITHSLQNYRPLRDPAITRTLINVQQAKDEDLAKHLDALLPQLQEWTSRRTPDERPILLVEDDAFQSRVVRKELAMGQRPICVAKTLKEAHVILAENRVSLAILDINLPDGDGRDFLVAMKSNPRTTTIPVIILSSKNDEDVKTECFALGADAYFEKPADLMTLSAAVLVKLQQGVDSPHAASLDPVTRLPNRMVFYNAYKRAALLASRTKEPLTLAILDLDRFKSVNDLLGHPTGDLVLQKVSSLLLNTLRASDLLVRWGGEEFAILFHNTDLTQARAAVNKALTALRRLTFGTTEGRKFKMTFSAGLAEVDPEDSVEQSVAEADRYLYLAKAAGRNHVLSKEDRLDNLKRNILLVEDDDFMASLLRRFLEKEGFRIFHARTGKGAFALCSQAAFSLITLDVKLPDVDGFELLTRFRQTPTTRHVPIIMLTSASNEENIVRGFKLGADDYIVKPFSPSQFLARVHRSLEK